MPVIPENYRNNKYDKTQKFDNSLKDQEFKKQYEDLKNRIDEINTQNEASKENLLAYNK